MIKSISILLSMLLLISAAQVEAKLQMSPTKQQANAENSEKTESYVSQINLVTLLSMLLGGLSVLGYQKIYRYFNPASGNQPDGKDLKDRKGASHESDEKKSPPERPQTPAVPVSSSSSSMDPAALSKDAAANELKKGVASFVSKDCPKCDKLSNQVTNQNELIASHEKTNKELLTKLHATETKLLNPCAQCSKLQGDIKKAQAQAQAQVKELQEKLSVAQAQSATPCARCNELEAKLSAPCAQCSRLQEDIKKAQAQAQAQVKELQEKLSVAQTKPTTPCTSCQEKDRLIGGQRKTILDERAFHAQTRAALSEAQKALELSKSHVAGLSSSDALTNPTDVSVCFPGVQNSMKAYIEEMHGRLFKNKDVATKAKEFLAQIVSPQGGPAVRFVPKHLFMAALSQLLFKHFNEPTFCSGGDSCVLPRDEERNNFATEYLELTRCSFDDAMYKNTKFKEWYAVNVEAFEKMMRPFTRAQLLDFEKTFLTPSFRQFMKSLYSLHCLCYSFYPRPDLITRQPGSTAVTEAELIENWDVFYKRADEGTPLKGKAIGFMLFPGLAFEKTTIAAIVYMKAEELAKAKAEAEEED